MRTTVCWLALCFSCGASPAQHLDLTDGVAPLSRPTAPGALRGLTVCIEPVCLEPGSSDPMSARVAIYLHRLLRGAGAKVAYERNGTPATDKPLALAARAHLELQITWTKGAATTPAIALPKRRAEDATAALETTLARSVEAHLGPSARRACPPSPVVKLGIHLTGTTDTLAHRAPAHALFESVVDWWRTGHQRIVALHRKVHGPSKAPGTSQPFFRRFWPLPRSPQTEAEVAAMLRGFIKGYVVDATQVHLDVRVRKTADGWLLSGSTELPVLAQATRSLLQSAGVVPLKGALRILPDQRAGDPPFGIVTARAAQTWSKPGRASGNALADGPGQGEETELLRDEPVRILDAAGHSLLVHAASGYLGWVPASAVRRCPANEFAAALSATTTGGAGERVARTALKAIGTPYLFGGRGRDGIDCSGLAQTSWETRGVFLPRDARMQVLVGKLIATARQPAPLQPGDLLFFTNSRGRISHVAVSLGGSRFVHATPPEVTLGSLDPKDSWYTPAAKRFCLAKRVAR